MGDDVDIVNRNCWDIMDQYYLFTVLTLDPTRSSCLSLGGVLRAVCAHAGLY